MDGMSSTYLEYIEDEAGILYFIAAMLLIVGIMGGALSPDLYLLIPFGLLFGGLGFIHTASEQGWVDWVNTQ